MKTETSVMFLVCDQSLKQSFSSLQKPYIKISFQKIYNNYPALWHYFIENYEALVISF